MYIVLYLYLLKTNVGLFGVFIVWYSINVLSRQSETPDPGFDCAVVSVESEYSNTTLDPVLGDDVKKEFSLSISEFVYAVVTTGERSWSISSSIGSSVFVFDILTNLSVSSIPLSPDSSGFADSFESVRTSINMPSSDVDVPHDMNDEHADTDKSETCPMPSVTRKVLPSSSLLLVDELFFCLLLLVLLTLKMKISALTKHYSISTHNLFTYCIVL